MVTKTLACGFLALLLGGCPNRQAGPRVVYAPSPPPAAASSAPESGGTLVIEEPPPPSPPPSPASMAAPATPTPAVAHHQPRLQKETADEKSVPESAPPAARGEAPPLEPRESAPQEGQIVESLNKLDQDITRLEARSGEGYSLTAVDRRTLTDARTFLREAQQALQDRDLLRAQQLAQKASQLVTAVQQRP